LKRFSEFVADCRFPCAAWILTTGQSSSIKNYSATVNNSALPSRARGRIARNDNCYVEQKNYSVVRQTVGYQRFDTAAELMVLQRLYATLRLYTNFFQPTMKLKSKERLGSKVKKSYHAPQTPYQRILACAEVSVANKKR
jgi:hypothetical protein